jgi:hypothetical protein
MNLTPVLVSYPYAASRSSTAWRRPRSPETGPVVERRRRSKTSRQEESRRENWRGVLTGWREVLVAGSWEGNIVLWWVLFWDWG